jgi:hypothetical protein
MDERVTHSKTQPQTKAPARMTIEKIAEEENIQHGLLAAS